MYSGKQSCTQNKVGFIVYPIFFTNLIVIVYSSRICPSELIALSDRVSEFRALNTEVVACSVDSYLSHQAWSRTLRSDGGIAIPKMPLLSDPTHAISKSYGCYLSELGHSLRY